MGLLWFILGKVPDLGRLGVPFRGPGEMGVQRDEEDKQRSSTEKPTPKVGKSFQKTQQNTLSSPFALFELSVRTTHTNAHVSLSIHLECLTREKRSRRQQKRSCRRPKARDLLKGPQAPLLLVLLKHVLLSRGSMCVGNY